MSNDQTQKYIENERNTELSFLYQQGRELAMHRLPDKYREPGYLYRPVIITYTQPMELLADIRIPKMIEDGWEVVYTDAPNLDFRGNAPVNKQNVRKAPFVVTRKSGHKALWMRIDEKKMKERNAAKAEKNDRKLVEAVTQQIQKDQIRIKGQELDAKEFM